MNHENTAHQTWLRGYQVTGANGVVQFKTIFPGWYSSRTPHIHFKVRTFSAQHQATSEFTSQLFFHDRDIDRIYTHSPYDTRANRDTTNANDSVYNDRQVDGSVAGSHLLLDLKQSETSGYKSQFAIVLTDENTRPRSRRGGGPGGFGGPPPGGPPPPTVGYHPSLMTGKPTVYNKFAGQSPERLAALSDGLFAIAMTLLIIDIHVPKPEGIHSDQDLLDAICTLSPRFLMYLMSFMTLGIFWVGQQTQLNFFERADRNLTWIHIAFLAIVALMPFSTALLAEFITFRTALVIYWLNILLAGIVIYASWNYAVRKGLLKEDTPPEISAAMKRRVIVAQSLYALGAALCIFSTSWSIGFIVLVQLNYVIAPKIKPLFKL